MQLKYQMVTIEDLVPEDHFFAEVGEVAGLVICIRGDRASVQP